MKESDEPAQPAESMELAFPDWSGMEDSSARITPEAAFSLCELYPQPLANARKGKPGQAPRSPFPNS